MYNTTQLASSGCQFLALHLAGMDSRPPIFLSVLSSKFQTVSACTLPQDICHPSCSVRTAVPVHLPPQFPILSMDSLVPEIKLSLDLCFLNPPTSFDIFRLGFCWDFSLPVKNTDTTQFCILLGLLSDAQTHGRCLSLASNGISCMLHDNWLIPSSLGSWHKSFQDLTDSYHNWLTVF